MIRSKENKFIKLHFTEDAGVQVDKTLINEVVSLIFLFYFFKRDSTSNIKIF